MGSCLPCSSRRMGKECGTSLIHSQSFYDILTERQNPGEKRMKRNFCMAILCAFLIGEGSVYGSIPGACPDVPLGWKGTTALEGWAMDDKYVPRLQAEKKYVCVNSWLYTPKKGKPAICEYSTEG